jgi:hypothetical protein
MNEVLQMYRKNGYPSEIESIRGLSDSFEDMMERLKTAKSPSERREIVKANEHISWLKVCKFRARELLAAEIDRYVLEMNESLILDLCREGRGDTLVILEKNKDMLLSVDRIMALSENTEGVAHLFEYAVSNVQLPPKMDGNAFTKYIEDEGGKKFLDGGSDLEHPLRNYYLFFPLASVKKHLFTAAIHMERELGTRAPDVSILYTILRVNDYEWSTHRDESDEMVQYIEENADKMNSFEWCELFNFNNPRLFLL